MKVTVNKYLNVRVGKPSVNAPNYQYLAPGSELEVDGKLYEGDPYDGNTSWYKDEAGNFYWSGGVESIIEKEELPIISDFEKVLDSYSGDGKGLGVAFLDSGVNDKHPHLKNRITYYESFLPDNSKSNISSHGNLVAGILASDEKIFKRNKSDLLCFRVAFKSRLSENRVNNKAVFEALMHIQKNKTKFKSLKIINLSLNISISNIKKIQPIIDILNSRGITVVVAAGQNTLINKTAHLTNVIKVGVFDSWNFSHYAKNGFPISDCVYFLNHMIPSYSLTGNTIDDEINQDSAYCAFVSSIIAKKISNNNNLNNLKYLIGISQSIRTEDNLKIFQPYI
jgi:subtilisin